VPAKPAFFAATVDGAAELPDHAQSGLCIVSDARPRQFERAATPVDRVVKELRFVLDGNFTGFVCCMARV
jgi:hypothetical protein